MLNIQIGTISRCHKYLDGMGKINKQSVQNLSQETKDFLREITPVRLKELAQMNYYAADKIKKALDGKYGVNNYVLIAVGRSISSIVELMGQMGVNTKIIPMSGLRRRGIDNISPENLTKYKKFLSKIGLNKKELKRDKDKTYILMDYTYYGRSLEKTNELLKKDELLGNVSNLITMPIQNVLREDYERMGFKRLFEYCRFKDYSYVGKLPIDNLKDVFKVSNPDKNKEFQGNITKGLRQLFWFNVFVSAKQKNFKNVMPDKELEAIYKHYLSQKAINNYLKREITKINELVK